MKLFYAVLLLRLMVTAGLVSAQDVITIDPAIHQSGWGTNGSTFASPVFVVCTNPAFRYYSVPNTNVPSAAGTWDQVPNGDQYWMNLEYAPGAILNTLPPVEMAFDFTGTNLELVYNNSKFSGGNGVSWEDFTITEGTNVTSRLACPEIPNNAVQYTPVFFSQNITHHLTIRLLGAFYGINIKPGESITPRIMPKQNLLLVLGDSYVQGYSQSYPSPIYATSWLDGWVLQLENMVANLVAFPSGVGGTGFTTTNTPYLSRVDAELCAYYTNAINSGKYNNIFITASGTINDFGHDTNSLYTNALAVYQHILASCPTARVFFLGTMLHGGIGSNTNAVYPDSSGNKWDTINETIQSGVAAQVGIPFISLLRSGVVNSTNLLHFYGNDDVHPNQYGYNQMAAFVNSQLGSLYGTNWDPNYVASTNPPPNTKPAINVSNYGAVGDASQLYVSTTSNSVVVTTTQWLSTNDIGKAIELFGVGTQTVGLNESGVQSINYQDLVATITDVVNGTNIYISQACQQTLTNVLVTYGTDNTPAFSNAVSAVSSFDPAVINIPAGKYLFIARAGAWQWCGIYLDRAGISFVGDSPTNTTLLAQGAWTLRAPPSGGSPIATRGAMFEVHSPISDPNPIVIANLTLDGGVVSGRQNFQGQSPANPVTGNGWDGTSTAYVETGDQGNSRPSLQILTNLVVVHWRGEMVKTTSSYTNGNALIENCVFGDGNATALNFYPTLDIGGCTFTNLFQIMEYYADYSYGASVMHNCFSTNIWGNGIAFNGGTTLPHSFAIVSNSLYFNFSAANILEFMPAENITIANNIIAGVSGMTVFSFSPMGEQPGIYFPDCNRNINIINNQIFCSDGGSLGMLAQLSGDGLRSTYGLNISSNTVNNCASAVIQEDGYATNLTFSFNTFNNGPAFQTGQANATNEFGHLTPFLFIQANNNLPAHQFGNQGNVGITESVGYGNGAIIGTANLGWSVIILQDSATNQIPVGAFMEVDNTSNQYSAGMSVYPSATACQCLLLNGYSSYGNVASYNSSSPHATVAPGHSLTFWWSGSAWTTNVPVIKPLPPRNLRLSL